MKIHETIEKRINTLKERSATLELICKNIDAFNGKTINKSLWEKLTKKIKKPVDFKYQLKADALHLEAYCLLDIYIVKQNGIIDIEKVFYIPEGKKRPVLNSVEFKKILLQRMEHLDKKINNMVADTATVEEKIGKIKELLQEADKIYKTLDIESRNEICKLSPRNDQILSRLSEGQYIKLN